MPTELDPRAIRAEAREALLTAQVPPLRFSALFYAVTLALSLLDAVAGRAFGGVEVMSFSLSFVGILISLAASVLSAGFVCYSLRVLRGEAAPYQTLLDAFPFAGKVVALLVMQGALLGAGLALFIVPGVVLWLTYSQAIFHLCDRPERGVLDAMRRSREEMRGRRLAYLALLFGFLPLLLFALGVLLFCQELLSPLLPQTLAGDALFVLASGILTAASQLYLRPWLTHARAIFYARVKTEA